MIAGIDVTFRYRVGWAVPLDPSAVSLSDVREFRTLAAAERYQAEISSSGREALLQVGVLQWTSPERAEAMVQEAVAAGARLQ